MSKKLTPWFSESVKPARVGVYLATVDKGERYYRRWDGETWYIGGVTPEEAAPQDIPTRFSPGGMFWRGLAKEPK